MSEWASRLEEDPELVFKEVPFNIRVPRPFGALNFKFNEPVSVHKFLPPMPKPRGNYPDNVIKDLEGTVFWLTGGPDGMRSEETDIYGVVSLNVDLDVSSILTDVTQFVEEDTEKSKKKAAKTYTDLQDELVKNTKRAMAQARELADARVKRAIRITHHNLKKQWETLREQGQGVFSPSLAEAVGAHILSQEIDKAGENRKKMIDRLNNFMNQTVIR